MRVYLGGRRYRVETIGTADDNAAADGVAVLKLAAGPAPRPRAPSDDRGPTGRPGAEEPAGPTPWATRSPNYMSWFEEHRRESAVDAAAASKR